MALDRASFGIERLSKPTRTGLMLVAIVGTLLYVGSFLLLKDSRDWGRVGLGVGVSAVVAWVFLGLLLQAISRQSVDPARRWGEWADTCLMTMGVGQVILMVSVVINLLAAWYNPGTPLPGAGFHVAVLVLADIAMGWVFVVREWRAGQPAWLPAVLWTVIMNGSFVVMTWALSRPLGYA